MEATDHDIQQAIKVAKRLCRELLVRKSPNEEQRIHINKALHGLDAFPEGVSGTSIEISLRFAGDRNSEDWTLQVYEEHIHLSNGGSMWSHGYDNYSNYLFRVESAEDVDVTGDLSSFSSIFDEVEWADFELYTHDDSPDGISRMLGTSTPPPKNSN